MKVPLLSPPHAKRYVQHVHSRYGVPVLEMKNWVWAQHRESIFVLSEKMVPLLNEKDLNLFSAGLQAFTNAKKFQPTTNFITLMGNSIIQNRVEIPETKLEPFFGGKKISRESCILKNVLSDGWVAVSLNGKVIASGELTRNHLIPNLPGVTQHADSE